MLNAHRVGGSVTLAAAFAVNLDPFGAGDVFVLVFPLGIVLITWLGAKHYRDEW